MTTHKMKLPAVGPKFAFIIFTVFIIICFSFANAKTYFKTYGMLVAYNQKDFKVKINGQISAVSLKYLPQEVSKNINGHLNKMISFQHPLNKKGVPLFAPKR